MKRTIILLVITFLSISARADWGSNYHIRFTIEAENGKIGNGYAYISRYSFNMDSLENKAYLKEAIDQNRVWDWWEEGNDTLTFFQNRIEYEYEHKYQIWDEIELKEVERKDTVYYLTNKKRLSFKDIKAVRINEVIECSPFIEVSSELQLSDTTWLKQAPIKTAFFMSNWGFICSHRIFIHTNSEKVDSVIKQLELKQKELEAMTNEEIYENVSEISEGIQGIVKQLNGEKVVVISECTD